MADLYETPEELLSRLKLKWAKPIPRGKVNDEVLSAYLKQIDDAEEETTLDFVLRQRILPVLDEEKVNLINSTIAFGVLDTPILDAMCVKNVNEKYAIVINRGLLDYVNKFMKFSLAFVDSSQVIYCQFVDVADVKPEIYMDMRNMMVETYLSCDIPFAPLLRFGGSMAIVHAEVLIKALVFIFSHEMAHFFNGDFQDRSNFVLLEGMEDVYKFDGNHTKKKEYNADIEAYCILRNVSGRFYNSEYAEAHILETILVLFDAIAHINEKESITHPSPRDRINNIVNEYYKEDMPKGYRGNNLPL